MRSVLHDQIQRPEVRGTLTGNAMSYGFLQMDDQPISCCSLNPRETGMLTALLAVWPVEVCCRDGSQNQELGVGRNRNLRDPFVDSYDSEAYGLFRTILRRLHFVHFCRSLIGKRGINSEDLQCPWDGCSDGYGPSFLSLCGFQWKKQKLQDSDLSHRWQRGGDGDQKFSSEFIPNQETSTPSRLLSTSRLGFVSESNEDELSKNTIPCSSCSLPPSSFQSNSLYHSRKEGSFDMISSALSESNSRELSSLYPYGTRTEWNGLDQNEETTMGFGDSSTNYMNEGMAYSQSTVLLPSSQGFCDIGSAAMEDHGVECQKDGDFNHNICQRELGLWNDPDGSPVDYGTVNDQYDYSSFQNNMNKEKNSLLSNSQSGTTIFEKNTNQIEENTISCNYFDFSWNNQRDQPPTLPCETLPPQTSIQTCSTTLPNHQSEKYTEPLVSPSNVTSISYFPSQDPTPQYTSFRQVNRPSKTSSWSSHFSQASTSSSFEKYCQFNPSILLQSSNEVSLPASHYSKSSNELLPSTMFSLEEEPTPFPFEQDVSLGSYGFLDEDRVLPTEETKNSFEVVPHEDPSCLSIPEDSISSTPSQDCVRAPSLDPPFTASEQPSQQEWETDSLSFCSSFSAHHAKHLLYAPSSSLEDDPSRRTGSRKAITPWEETASKLHLPLLYRGLEGYVIPDKWLTGPQYVSILNSAERGESNYKIYSLGFDKKSVTIHPSFIYISPSPAIYLLRCDYLKGGKPIFGFPRVKGVNKKYTWKKQGFTTVIPKQNPCIRYITANCYLSASKARKGGEEYDYCYNEPVLRMHAIMKVKRDEHGRCLRSSDGNYLDAGPYVLVHILKGGSSNSDL